MKKEYTWEISLDGVEHSVSCELSGNKYQLWMDDAFVTNVYRLSRRKMQFGLEQQIHLDGKECLFIVWDETPDLVINGVLQSSRENYTQAREMRKKQCTKWFRILFWGGLLWTCLAVAIGFLPVEILSAEQVFKAVWFGLLLMIGGGVYWRKWNKW